MAAKNKSMDIRLEKIGKTNSFFVQKEINYKNQIIEKIVLYFDVTRKEVKNISHIEKISKFAVITYGDKINY